MSNPSPVLDISGRVHAVSAREVASVPARPEQRDDQGRITAPALPARDGYIVQDVTVLTSDGGFATVSLLPDALSKIGGELPSPGDEVTYPVRCFVRWAGQPGRKYAVPGYSLAGDVAASRRSSGRRLAPAASAAS